MKGLLCSVWRLMIRKAVAALVIAAFVLSPSTTYAQAVLDLPAPGTMVLQSPAYTPVVLRAIKIRPDEPLVFDFVVDAGNTGLEGDALKREIEKIAKYFLATLTIPQKDLWVNLSPYERDRIIADEFGQTEMGRDMLAQDYILKQLASSLVNPDSALGQEFWQKLYAAAQEKLGTTEIPMGTFNKVWIVPEKSVVYEKDNAAILGETHLKLMMEEDYLAQEKGTESTDWAVRINEELSDADRAAAQVSSQIMRKVVLPEIEKEVNTGKNFSILRQMFSAIILATWYKEAVKDSLLAQMYEDQKKIAGVNIDDPDMREKIFEQYVAAYKKGVFDFIREDKDPTSGEYLPRKYFSGGVNADAQIERQPVGAFDEAALGAGALAEEDLIRSTIALGKPAVIGSGEMDAASDGAAEEVMGGRDQEAAMATVSGDPEVFVQKLGLASFDAGYLKGLYAKYLKSRVKAVVSVILKIGESFIPSALMSRQDREEVLGAKDYETQVRREEYLEAAKDVVFWSNPMNGGLGTSVARARYLKQTVGRDNIGAKATDLYYPLEFDGFDEKGAVKKVEEQVSIAELQLLQALTQDGAYRMQILQSFVNDESLVPMQQFMETTYLFDRLDQRPGTPKRTYRQMFAEAEHIRVPDQLLMQEVLPVVDPETGLLTDEFLAPGGHGQLGTAVLQEAPDTKLPPEGIQIRALFNGDGTNNEPDPYVAGWMAKERIPIVMSTTTRTPLDAKGGIIGVLIDGLKKIATIMEIGQAKAPEVKQESLFLALGLTEGEKGGQFFNTNTALTNDTLLSPFLRELREILGAEKFAEVTTPDLIANGKEKGPQKKKVIQMEGALGSALLNLNRFVTTTDDVRVQGLMKKYGFERLVYFVNYDINARINAFAPVKYSWDHWLYAYSGHFSVDRKTWRIVNNVGAHLPAFNAMDKHYEDVQNMIDAFGRANVNEMDEISIKGVVNLSGAVLRGKVVIENGSGQEIDLHGKKEIPVDAYGRILLDNVRVVIDQAGGIFVRPVGAASAEKAMEQTSGGIDFDQAVQSLQIERTGSGIKVHVDPAMIQRIQTGGFDGLAPVVIDVIRVRGILPALGMGGSAGDSVSG